MLSNFKKGVPILEKELLASGLSEEQIANLVSNGELREYEPIEGVYYINEFISYLDFYTDTIISASDVVEKLYLGVDFEYGFYYKDSLLNKFGFSTQVPNVVSIVTTKVDNFTRLSLDGKVFDLYPYNDVFRDSYNRDFLYKYIIILIEKKYKNYLDISQQDYFNKLEEWGLSNYISNLDNLLIE